MMEYDNLQSQSSGSWASSYPQILVCAYCVNLLTSREFSAGFDAVTVYFSQYAPLFVSRCQLRAEGDQSFYFSILVNITLRLHARYVLHLSIELHDLAV